MARAVPVRGLALGAASTAQLVGLTGDLKTNTVSDFSLRLSPSPTMHHTTSLGSSMHTSEYMQINVTVVLKQTKSSVIEILFEINLETVLLSSLVLIQTFSAALTWTPTHHKQKWIGIPHFIFHHIAVVLLLEKRGLP